MGRGGRVWEEGRHATGCGAFAGGSSGRAVKETDRVDFVREQGGLPGDWVRGSEVQDVQVDERLSRGSGVSVNGEEQEGRSAYRVLHSSKINFKNALNDRDDDSPCTASRSRGRSTSAPGRSAPRSSASAAPHQQCLPVPLQAIASRRSFPSRRRARRLPEGLVQRDATCRALQRGPRRVQGS